MRKSRLAMQKAQELMERYSLSLGDLKEKIISVEYRFPRHIQSTQGFLKIFPRIISVIAPIFNVFIIREISPLGYKLLMISYETNS